MITKVEALNRPMQIRIGPQIVAAFKSETLENEDRLVTLCDALDLTKDRADILVPKQTDMEILPGVIASSLNG